MVGNSLSFCVRDIADGKVSLDAVTKIRCSFDPPRDRVEFMDRTLAHYRKTYWSQYPATGIRIALLLWDTGRLEFTGGHYLPSEGIWGDHPLVYAEKTTSPCLHSVYGRFSANSVGN